MASGAIAAIEIPSIIEKGSRDEIVKLEGGGRIHLRMSFVLTDEERKKIETMVRNDRCETLGYLIGRYLLIENDILVEDLQDGT